MKTLASIALGAITLFAASCRQQQAHADTSSPAPAPGNDTKVLVVYFSATGTTRNVAKKIADATGGDLFEIVMEQPYSDADLDWHDNNSRSSLEMKDPESRPALKADDIETDDYDLIYIGYPIWWDEAPRAVNSFIDSHSLEGLRVIPFATSGGSGIEPSVAALKRTYPTINWRPGKLLNRPSDADIKTFTAK